HLEGYRGSRPVRVGNGAHDQVQIDVYGEVVRSFAHCAGAGIPAASGAEHFLRGLGDTVCASWDEPDHGIWESRGPRGRHTLSMALCAVALEDLLGMHDQGVIRVPVERYREVSQRIRREIETNGYNSDIGSYTATPDGEQVDASLLTLPLYGYIDAADPRMQSTLRRIREQLARGNLYYRSEVASDGSQEEGTFAVCAFWAIELVALAGEFDHARKAFEDVLSYANDVGLFAEEIDPDSGDALGNMPQAFTHIGLINAAVALVEQSPE
ncbi:MAG: glycoside hydrolase family 15 protein, partial [Gemmatimonadota bacterium]